MARIDVSVQPGAPPVTSPLGAGATRPGPERPEAADADDADARSPAPAGAPHALPGARGRSRDAYAGRDEAALVAGVRAGDPAAWDAFFVRFEPVLVRDARRIGVPDGLRDELVCETIGATLELLADPDGVAPGALGGYLR